VAERLKQIQKDFFDSRSWLDELINYEVPLTSEEQPIELLD